MNAQIPEEKLERIKDALFQRNRIVAIKLYREFVAGAGLAESKNAVEKIEAELRAATPEKFRAPDSPELFSVVMIIAATIIVIGIVWLIVR